MVNLTFLTKRDVENLNDNIGFTDNELCILNNLVSDKYNDEGLMLNRHLSRNKFYDIKAKMLYKIIKYAAEK